MRKALDRLYGAALTGACLAMAAIATLVFIQVMGRIIDRALLLAGFSRIGIAVPSLAEIGGFLFVAASCLALAPTLRAAVHVRVTLLVRFFGPLGRRVLATVVLVLATGLALFATWFVVKQAIDAHTLGRVSFGLVRIPLWIPQSVMALGFVIFVIALADELITALRGADPAFRRAEIDREEGAQ